MDRIGWLGSEGKLESFREFFRESAMRTLGAILIGALVLSSASFAARARSGRRPVRRTSGRLSSRAGFGRLSLIGPEQPSSSAGCVFERGAVETADDRIHLFRIGRVDKGEPLGLLRLGIANYLYVVEDQVFCV